MNEFLLVFRRDFVSKAVQPSPEQLQAIMKPWQEWMMSLNAQDILVDAGNRLTGEGRVVKGEKLVTDGPYVETKEAVGGYLVVKAKSIDEAAELAKSCPILAIGGNVEVRAILGSGKAFLQNS